MRCSYCKVIDSGQTLNRQDIRNFILKESNFLNSHVSDIHLLGGEPCLEFALVKSLLQTLREDIRFKGRILIFTNGTLMTAYRASILEAYGVKVIVSIDSTGPINDTERLFRSNSGAAFDKAFRAVNLVGHDKVRIHITVTACNLDALPEFLSYLSEVRIHDVGIFPADYAHWSDKNIARIDKTIRDVLDIYREEFSFVTYLRKTDATLKGRKRCNRIYLGPDGNFYLCKCFSVLPYRHKMKYMIGSLQDGFDMKKRARILSGLYDRIQSFEKARYRSREWKSLLPHIYCPLNSLIYSMHIKRKPDSGLARYYNVMRAFHKPFIELAMK
jgi:sulfatase maturation enzyme AslB (radical SAM superfamily)